MKYKGQVLDKPNYEIIVIPRGEDEPIVFRAEAVLDYTEFEQLCPLPMPPTVVKPGGEKSQDIRDEKYKKKIEEHGTRRFAWMILKSLQATKDLEWETVKMEDPETWQNYEKELRDAKFSEIEITHILNGIFTANCLNEEKIDEARKSFLAGQLEKETLSFHQAEL